MENKPPIFIAIPTHDSKIDVRMANILYGQSTKDPHVIVTQNSSLLAMNCNTLWCMALNKRIEHKLKWFAMIHSDIIPEAYWLDKLISIAEEKGADLLSVVVPIKSADGITSTGISKNNGHGIARRITQTEVMHKDFPETFSIDDVFLTAPFKDMVRSDCNRLPVNTGCMICRVDQLWSDEVFFTINDTIERQFSQYITTVEPEDWFFSRMVGEKGGKVMATKAVQVLHVGQNAYNSHQVWGKAVDPLFQTV